MRFTSETLGFLLLFGVTHAQSAYDATCSPPPTPDQVLEPGIVVTYTCGQGPDPSSWNKIKHSASTPKDCAKKCAKRTSDGPCGWYADQCFEYETGGAVTGIPGMVMVETRKDWDKMKEAYDKCMTSGGGGGGGPPGPVIGGPPVSSTLADIEKNCKEETFNHAGREWEVFCTKWWDNESYIAEYKNDPSIQTMAQCFDKCIATAGCNGISWENYSKTCSTNTLTDSTRTGSNNNMKRLREVTK